MVCLAPLYVIETHYLPVYFGKMYLVFEGQILTSILVTTLKQIARLSGKRNIRDVFAVLHKLTTQAVD